MHHCDVLCLVLSSLCSLPAYHYAEHLGSSKMPLVCAPCLLVLLLLYSAFNLERPFLCFVVNNSCFCHKKLNVIAI